MEQLERCYLHKSDDAQGQCAICNEFFCEACLVNKADIILCSGHAPAFDVSQFILLLEVNTSAETPQAGILLYELKELLWRQKAIHCFIKTTYGICNESQLITSCALSLFS